MGLLKSIVVGLLIVAIGVSIYFHYSSLPQIGRQAQPAILKTTTPTTSPTKGDVVAAAQRLVGKRKQTNNPDKSLGETYIIEFRSDGTFAMMHDGAIDTYNSKMGMGPPFPASATSTGLWSIITDPSAEEAKWDANNPTEHPLRLSPIQGETILLKEDVGFDWYSAASIDGSGTTLVMKPLGVPGGIQGTYVRVRN